MWDQESLHTGGHWAGPWGTWFLDGVVWGGQSREGTINNGESGKVSACPRNVNNLACPKHRWSEEKVVQTSEYKFWIQSWLQTSSGTSGKSLNLSEPRFPIFKGNREGKCWAQFWLTDLDNCHVLVAAPIIHHKAVILCPLRVKCKYTCVCIGRYGQ